MYRRYNIVDTKCHIVCNFSCNIVCAKHNIVIYGCYANVKGDTMEKRFIKTYTQSTFGTETKILVDRETGVNYLFHQSGHAGGLTPLLDKDGKPVVTTVEE